MVPIFMASMTTWKGGRMNDGDGLVMVEIVKDTRKFSLNV